ncbi:MAG: ROK family protein [Rhizobiales bacterium]|nr:ROK family protein [Hyphomicrobiales bacterium]
MSGALGIDIGGTGIKLAIVADDGRPVETGRIPTDPDRDPESTVAAIAAASAPLVARFGKPRLRGVGVAVAGFIDSGRSHLEYNPNLHLLTGFPLRAAIEEALDMPATLEVDSNAQAIAEYEFGAGKGARRLAFYSLGTGVGGGLLFDGEPLRFFGGCAGDMGHVIIDFDGPVCACGARGCLEAMVGRGRIEAKAGRPIEDLLSKLRESNTDAMRIFEEVGHSVGLALASTVQLYGPDRYVVGGGLSLAGDVLFNSIRNTFRQVAAPPYRGLDIVEAAFGSFGGAIGAAVEWLRADGACR